MTLDIWLLIVHPTPLRKSSDMTPPRVSLDVPPVLFAVWAALPKPYATVAYLQTSLSGCRPGDFRHRRPSQSQYSSLKILPVCDLVIMVVLHLIVLG